MMSTMKFKIRCTQFCVLVFCFCVNNQSPLLISARHGALEVV